jgi:hypothetical protein
VSIASYIGEERVTVTGTVCRRRVTRREPDGAYITIMMIDDNEQAAEFTWLHWSRYRPVPASGQRITVSGRLTAIPNSPVSLIGTEITIHEQEEAHA